MLTQLPAYISLVFILTTFLTVALFYKASHYSKQVLVILSVWLSLEGIVGYSGFYTVTNTLPPRFIFLILIPVLLIIATFFTEQGKQFIDSLDVKWLTLLHVVRIPVELVLYWLFLNKAVPELMTFEGRNFDILSGLTAPVVFYFGYVKKSLGKYALLAWNIVCLGLLVNIVANAVLSAPFPFQKFAFDQPNIAVLYFPFVWLPCCIVPLVLFSHLASIRIILKS
ncbi:MAG: hypothetical protein IPP32_07610 [Bacteroidetes bacterium]|nr:hypothetical protein [Bacteroidota bacterium]